MRRTVSLRTAILAPLVVAVIVTAAAIGAVGPSLPAADAGGQNRAVVVVDTGSSVRAACVLFSESSITGAEALRRSGMSPVFQGFSGLGSGVCSLNGVGCPSDGSCLTCQAPSYWQYWRSSGGGFSYSSAGASSTSVTDGSIEGWRWGAQQSPPPVRSVDAVCGPATPPSTSPPGTAPPAAPAPGAPAAGGSGGVGAGGSGTGGSGGGSSGDPGSGNADPTTDDQPDETSSTTEPEQDAAAEGSWPSKGSGEETEIADEQAGSLIRDQDGAASQAGSAALALGAFATVGFFVWRARRRNHLAAAGALHAEGDEALAPLERLDDGGADGEHTSSASPGAD